MSDPAVDTCLKKRPYRTRPDAERAARRFRRLYSKEYNIYECDVCYQWHLSKKARVKILRRSE